MTWPHTSVFWDVVGPEVIRAEDTMEGERHPRVFYLRAKPDLARVVLGSTAFSFFPSFTSCISLGFSPQCGHHCLLRGPPCGSPTANVHFGGK